MQTLVDFLDLETFYRNPRTMQVYSGKEWLEHFSKEKDYFITRYAVDHEGDDGIPIWEWDDEMVFCAWGGCDLVEVEFDPIRGWE